MTMKLIAALMVGAIIISPALACQPSDIEVKQADWRFIPGSVIDVVGEIFNQCSDPTVAKLSFIFRDANGKVAGVTRRFLDTAPPKASLPFEISASALPTTISMTVNVVSVYTP